jgi:hypothetical protein
MNTKFYVPKLCKMSTKSLSDIATIIKFVSATFLVTVSENEPTEDTDKPQKYETTKTKLRGF